jgi:peptidoglycan/xylan/chitin deacetylase (PgdA/CDA1 family)
MIAPRQTAVFQNRPSSLRRWKGRFAGWAGAPLATCLPPRHRAAFGILMYHRVTDRVPGASEPTWNVPPARFRQQLAGLLARGYEAWPLRRVLDEHEAGREVPRNVFVVTFDDGYENNLTEAYPILRELNVPATIFLATAYLDATEPFPSDDWPEAGSPVVPVGSWRPLTTAQCHELFADGLIELAAHTHTHRDFRGAPDALEADLRVCRQVLAERFGIEQPTFAFPYGTKKLGFSGPVLAEAARRAEMRCALTTEAELVLPGSDPFDWGRMTATGDDTAATLAGKLAGWYGVVRGAWRSARRADAPAPA